MKKWEYMEVHHGLHEGFLKELNMMGWYGWRVVHIFDTGMTFRAILEREVNTPEYQAGIDPFQDYPR